MTLFSWYSFRIASIHPSHMSNSTLWLVLNTGILELFMWYKNSLFVDECPALPGLLLSSSWLYTPCVTIRCLNLWFFFLKKASLENVDGINLNIIWICAINTSTRRLSPFNKLFHNHQTAANLFSTVLPRSNSWAHFLVRYCLRIPYQTYHLIWRVSFLPYKLQKAEASLRRVATAYTTLQLNFSPVAVKIPPAW